MSEKIKYEILAVVILILAISLLVALIYEFNRKK